VSYSNNSWTGNKEKRISVTGFITYMLGMPICWRSKGQKSVMLSSSKKEWIAILEVKDIGNILYVQVN
jgi:hypothetical protein